MTLHTVYLHTTVEVDDVCVFAKHIVILCGSTEVITEHTVISTVKNTTIRQHCNRQSIDVVWISIKVVITVAYSRSAHGAISHSLVRVVLYIVLLSGRTVLNCTKGCKFNLAYRLVAQFCLHTEVKHIEVDVVVFELVFDVERSIVAGVILVGIERT